MSTKRAVFAAATLAFVLLTLPLFSFTRAHNAGTSVRTSTSTSTRVSPHTGTHTGLASRTGTTIASTLRSLLTPATASAAPSDTLNFQARLQTASGAIVPDGYYNIEFKLYDAATAGTNLWTETHYDSNGVTAGNDNRVRVVNGYVSVYLGSITSFPSTIPWDQQLYLTMNVGGTTQTATPTYDGEMNPRLKLTAVPYAMQAKRASELATSSGANNATLSIAAPTSGNQTFVIQDQGAAGTYNILTAPNGSDGYVKLQSSTPGTQQTGNLNISGSGLFGGLLQGGTLSAGSTQQFQVDASGNVTTSGSLSTGASSLLTVGGATLNNTLGINDLATGGNIGTAAATVDIYTNFTVAQTTAGQTLTIPAPTNTLTGRLIYITNVGSAGYTLGGSMASPGTTMAFVWNSTTSTWTLVSSGTTGAYIQNGTALQTANFNIQSYSTTSVTATIQGANSQSANILEVKAAGVGTPLFSVGPSTISLGADAVLAANKTITITGGTTASRPASPTEGMLYYDTDTKQLLVYANGKWQGDRSTATKIVAASNSSQADKDAADYVADGTGDQVEINAALTAAAGGKVYLMEGTYTVSDSVVIPNNTTLAGAGTGTVVQLADLDADMYIIENADQTTGTSVVVQDMTLNGRNDLNTAGYQEAADFMGLGSPSLPGATLRGLQVVNFRGAGLRLRGIINSTITGNTFIGISRAGDAAIYDTGSGLITYSNNTFINNYWGMRIDGTSHEVVTSNTFYNNNAGITSNGAARNSISNNTFDGNAEIIELYQVSHTIVSGNISTGSGWRGIVLDTSSDNTVTGNNIQDSGDTGYNNAILVFGNSDRNSITGNVITDSSATSNNYAIGIGTSTADANYLADNTLGGGSINDAGTGTIYGGQSNGTVYLIQPTTNITIGSASTTTTIQGNTAVTLDATTGTTQVCRNASGNLSACDASYLTPTATNFIQNTTIQQTGNFNISGTGIANILQAGTFDTSSAATLNIGTTNATSITLGKSGVATTTAGGLLTSTIDTASAGTLALGTTNATSINLNQNTVLAAGKSITLAGGNTASRPASPTEGMIYYDTTTHQLLQWNGSKWVGDRTDTTKIVAASNSSQAAKDAADYVVTGTSDQNTINTALNAAAGGKVYLMEGTYTTDDAISIPNNTTLAGAGRGTLIQFANLAGASKNMIVNTDTTNGEGVVIRDLRIDGNTANVSGTVQGIYLNRVGSASSSRQGPIITNIWALNFRSNAVRLDTSSNGTISGNNFLANGTGLYLSSGNRLSISNNYFQSNVSNGMVMAGSLYNTISANSFVSNGAIAIQITGASQYNVINGNNLYDNTGNTANSSILFSGASKDNVITSNEIIDTAGTGYAINISDSASTTNYLADNYFSGTGATSINDAATGSTIYGGQFTTTGGAYTIQNAGGVAIASSATATASTATANISITTGNATGATSNSGNITLDTGTATGTTGTISIGTGNASAITIGKAGVTTTIQGNTAVTLNATTGTTMVCRNASGLLSACDATYLTPTASNFIQNQNASAQAANYWINGTARADTSVLTPLVDTATATALNIGTTNATQINLNQNTVLGAGKSITITGGTTASRPASPTEGMLYYDTTTKQLLVYSNGKWQGDRSTSTKIVAASNSSQAAKDGADYVADGEAVVGTGTIDGDQVQINAAIAALPASGGAIYLTEGTYRLDGSIVLPSNVKLSGAGGATIISVNNSFGSGLTFVTNSDTTNGNTNITIRDIKFDGNQTNNGTSTIVGISFTRLGSGAGATATAGATITNTTFNAFQGDMILFSTSNNNRVANNTFIFGNNEGVEFATGLNNQVIGNSFNNVNRAIDFADVDNSVITDNSIDTSADVNGAVDLTGGSSSNIVSGNSFKNNANISLRIATSNSNTITGNVFTDNGSTGAINALSIQGNSNYNVITNNTFRDTAGTGYAIDIAAAADDTVLSNNSLYGTGASSINDLGIGTIYGGQVNGAGNYVIQPAGTIELLKNTNVTGSLSASTSVITPYIDRSAAGTLSIGTTNATAITIGNATTTTNSVTLTSGATGSINLQSQNITTNQTTVNLLNTTATTVNAFGAATQLTMGASGSTTNLQSSNIYLGYSGATTLIGSGTAGMTIKTANATTATGSLGIWTGDSSTGASGSIGIDVGTAATTAGSVVIGSTNAESVHIGRTGKTTTIYGTTVVSPQASTSTTLLCSNSGAISTCDASVVAPTATNFIQNQNSTDQTADFRISGTARANTSVLTPLVDTATAVALNIGTTNATQINLNQNTQIAAGKNITFAAGAGNFDQSLSTGTFKTGTGAVSLNGDTTVATGKNLTVTNGTTDLTGTTNVNTSGTATTTIGNASATNTIAGTTGITGATTVNGTGAAATNLGTGTGNTTIGNTTGTVGVTGSAVTVTGTTSINTSGTASTSIGNGSTGTVTIGNGSTGAITLQSGTSIGLTAPTTITGNTSINTTGSGTTTIGSTSGGAVSVTAAAALTLQTAASGAITVGSQTAANTINIGAVGAAAFSSPIYIGTSTGAAQAVTLGSTNASSTTIINGASSIALNSATISTTATSLGLFNTTATTVTAFQAGTSISLGATTGTFTVRNANTTLGNAAGSGTFTNNGSTKNTTLALGDLTAGAIGTAAATVNVYTSFTIAPTASGRTYTIPAPTDAAAGRTIYVSNIHASSTFIIGSTTFNAHSTATLVYDGTSWNFAGMDGGSNNYIQNQSSADQAAAFRISGAGTLGGLLTANAGVTVVGTTSINGSGTANTSIGVGSTGTVTIGNGSTGAITLQSGTSIGLTAPTTITGATSINTTGSGTTTIGSIAAGAVSITSNAASNFTTNTGALTLQGAGGVSVLTANAATSSAITIQTGNSTAGTAASVGIDTGTSSTGTGTINIGVTNAGTVNISRAAAVVNILSNTTTLGTNGGSIVLQGVSGATGNALNIRGGAATTANNNGGSLILSGGAGAGTGAMGLVALSPTAFTSSSTVTVSASAALNTLLTNAVNIYSTVPVNATGTGYTLTIDLPTVTTVGRVLYVAAVNGSSDFTLALAGTSVNISMKANSTATLIYNGTGWTAAGASSSTDLQAAYNNTLASAGAAELVLNPTGGAADGLTIRNNGSAPIMGGILEVQSSIGTNLLSVNNYGTELAANGGAETLATFATNWTAAPVGGTVVRNTTAGQYVTGQAGAQVTTTTTANTGIRNNLSGNPVNTIGAKYQVSFTAKSSLAGTTVDVIYSRDGGTTPTACTDYGTGVAYATLSNTVWTKVTCTITIDSATAATNPDLIIRKIDGSTAPVIYIDNVSFIRNDSTTQPSNVQIGGGITGGQVTLFTLDRSSAPPVANGDSTYYGSMYYDTTTGRIQCYEADGWGACGSAPDNIVVLTPEYTGAVLNGTGVGTMTADFCSNEAGVLVAPAAGNMCANHEVRNFYKWTSPQPTAQTYSIYVNYKLPTTFKQFYDDNTIKLTALTDHITNGQVSYEIYRKDVASNTVTQCGGTTTVTSSANTWQTVSAAGNEYSSCSWTSGDNIIFKINVRSQSNANVYVENLEFRYMNV